MRVRTRRFRKGEQDCSVHDPVLTCVRPSYNDSPVRVQRLGVLTQVQLPAFQVQDFIRVRLLDLRILPARFRLTTIPSADFCQIISRVATGDACFATV